MKPRSFGAMREDRVRAMAQARFGRAFGSKADAVEALSRLPVAEQHGLKKPRGGSVTAATPKAQRPASAWARNFDAIRGGANAPNARTLAWTALNKPDVLRRYARAAVTIDAKSPLQALVVLSKHGATKRLKRAAGEAFGMFKNGHLAERIGEVSSGAQAMAKSLDDTLKGLSKADAIRLSEQVGAGSHKTKSAAIKAIGTESLRRSHAAHKSVIASNSTIFGTKPQLAGPALSSAAQAAGRKASAAFDAKVVQAIGTKVGPRAAATAAKVARAVPKNAAGLAIAGVIAAGAVIASSRASQASESKPAPTAARDPLDTAAAAAITFAGVGIGVAGIRNTSIADKAKALRDSLGSRAAERTAAAGVAGDKAGKTAGLLDRLFRPGKVPGINARAALAASRAETHTAVAGRLAAIAGQPGGIEGHLRAAHNARIASATGLSRTGAAIAGAILRNPGRTGVAMMAAGIAGLYVAQQARTKPGGAYLNDAAAAKAAAPAAAAPTATGGRAGAAPVRPDGETAGYSRQRRTATGLVIQEQVASYRTPTR